MQAFKSLRNRKPFKKNWLLFGSITEAFLLTIGEDVDKDRMNEGVTKLNEWYKGDGWYDDGPHLAFDYYNSFVIHQMMVDTLGVLLEHKLVETAKYDLTVKRMQRYAVGQERMISPEGTFPLIGRSITYRTSAFHALCQVALMNKLPKEIVPAQVRCALTLVKKNMYEVKGTFDNKGWLQLGFYGRLLYFYRKFVHDYAVFLTIRFARNKSILVCAFYRMDHKKGLECKKFCKRLPC